MIFHQIYFLDKKAHVDYLIDDEKYNNRFNAASNSHRLLLEKSTWVFQLSHQNMKFIKWMFDDTLIRLFMVQLILEHKEFLKYNERLGELIGFNLKLHKSFEKTIIEKLNTYISYTYSPNEYVMIVKTSLESLV